MSAESGLDEEMSELSSAEDFLQYFGINYDPAVVQVNRLHILQRFHDYLGKVADLESEPEDAHRSIHKALLQRAYQDFVESSALQEKVFKVFHMHEPEKTFVPLDAVLK